MGLSTVFRYEFSDAANIVRVEKCCSTRLIDVSRYCKLCHTPRSLALPAEETFSDPTLIQLIETLANC